jgi:hypothetical protein
MLGYRYHSHGFIHKCQPLTDTTPSRLAMANYFLQDKMWLSVGRLFQAYSVGQHFSFQEVLLNASTLK